jgi:type III restriction enzyme
MPRTIDRLIISSPYSEPTEHWSYRPATKTFHREVGRRPAGYVIADPRAKTQDDAGIFIELPLVNQIRPRVREWREAGYPGVTGITKRLLEHWHDPDQRDEDRRLFFCGLEAIETQIWLVEAPASERVGIKVPGDGGPFPRLCCKMATGTGKTVVMAMLIAWQVLNKVTYPQRREFSKNVFVVAPGLTVRNRLQVLLPSGPGNYYSEFGIVPTGLLEPLRRGRVLVRNWHALNWETEDQIARKRSVDKRGPPGDEAYVRGVLTDLAAARNMVVINDEAHHAWRVGAGQDTSGVGREQLDEATRWVGGLDRIHRSRGILCSYDFTATPFVPSGKRSSEEALFGWIVSDFGLYDAIESGLVKTPRVVVRDDGRYTSRYKSRLYHIYIDDEVRDDLNRRAEPHELLPSLVTNGYYLLGKDWLAAAQSWREEGHLTPPVMITVANRTETAARIKYAFDHGKILIEELQAPERTLHIDSKVLEKAEAREEAPDLNGTNGEAGEVDEEPRRKLTRDEQAEALRQIVDTIGRVGRPGEQIQNVISVGMLSEGWDARTVTHIMGLRAFSSQLLCEQVVGRGLRRVSYETDPETGLLEPEYVNIFGIPFTFLPHEGGDGGTPPPPPPKTRIEPVPDKRRFAISWPNIIRIDHTYRPRLSLDLSRVRPLRLNAYDTPTLAEIAPVVGGVPDISRLTEIDLMEIGRRFRRQKIIFEAARDLYDQMQPTWKGNRELLLAQLVGLVEQFVASDRIEIAPALFNQDDLRRRILTTLNMTKLVQHIWEAIRFENTEALEPIFDRERPIRSTGDMAPWYTGKPPVAAQRSHINFCVNDSTWEAKAADECDTSPYVDAWVKNDHLGFEILYMFNGVRHKFYPDFLIRLTNGITLVLELKGQDTPGNETKREFLAEWIRAVKAQGGFGHWAADVARAMSDVVDILHRHRTTRPTGAGR